MLARAGLEVDLGCRTRRAGRARSAARATSATCRASSCPRASVCAPPTSRSRATTSSASPCPPRAAAGRRRRARRPTSRRAPACSCSPRASSPPLGTLPAAYVAERTGAWAIGVARRPGARGRRRSRRRLARRSPPPTRLRAASSPTRSPPRASTCATSADVVGVELAGCAQERRRARRRRRCPAGPNAAGAAAGKVFAEVDAYARRAGARPETFAGLAGAGDLVATVLARARATAAPASCWRGHTGPTSARRSGRPPRRSTPCRCSPSASPPPASTRRRCAACGAHRGPDRAGALDGVAHRARRRAPRRQAQGRLSGVASGAWRRTRMADARPRRGSTPTSPSSTGAPARRLLLRLLPGRQPPRRRGPDGADLPAGLPALRARAARVRRPAAAAVADPHRPQPRGQLLPRPLAHAADADRRRGRAVRAAHDGGARRGPRRPRAHPGRRAGAARRPAGGADHALRARAWTTARSRGRWAARTARRRCCSTARSGSSRSSSRKRRRETEP